MGNFDEKWLETYLARVRAGEEIKVPCNGCTSCCRTKGLEADIAEDEIQKFRNRRWKGSFLAQMCVMPKDGYGACHMLGRSGCTIYSNRPKSCRTFDCRVHELRGGARVPHWQPTINRHDLLGPAWRTLMVASINAGLEQEIFGRRPRPSSDKIPWTFDFKLVDKEAVVRVDEASGSAVRVKAMLSPTERGRKLIRSSSIRGVERHCSAFAVGYLNRQPTSYLDWGGFRLSATMLTVKWLESLDIEPAGYADQTKLEQIAA